MRAALMVAIVMWLLPIATCHPLTRPQPRLQILTYHPLIKTNMDIDFKIMIFEAIEARDLKKL